MPDITISNFKGVYQKASTFDLPDMYAETCKDMLPTYEGKLVKRSGYAAATLNDVAFSTDTTTTVALGTIQSMFELVTGRDSTTAPNESRIYLAQTSAGNGRVWRWREDQATWHDISGTVTDMRDVDGTVQPARFLDDDGIVRVLTGNRSVNLPLWWGYVGNRFINAYSAVDGTKTDWDGGFLTTAQDANISKPVLSDYFVLATHEEPTGVTWETVIPYSGAASTSYAYKISIQYDNKQWTAPSEVDALAYWFSVFSTSDKKRVSILLTVNTASDSQRITGIRIYRKQSRIDWSSAGVPTAVTTSYNKVEQAYVNADAPIVTSSDKQLWPYGSVSRTATYTSATKTFKLDATLAGDDALSDDLYNEAILIAGTDKYCLITDTVFTATNDQTIVVADGTGLVNSTSYGIKIFKGWYKSGNDYKYLFVDTYPQEIIDNSPTIYSELGITDESVTDVNPELGTMVNGQAFYANTYHANESKAYIVAYGMLTSSGLIANDIHPILNAFTPGFPINGISNIGDRLIIYGSDKISRGILPSTNERSWDFEKLFDEYGLLAEHSLINIAGKDYFLATDWQIKVFDGSIRPQTISDGIYTSLQDAGDASIAYLQNAKATYMPKLNMYLIAFQTGASTYEYWGWDVQGQLGWVQFAWHVTNTTTDQNFAGFFRGQEGKSFAFTTTSVFLLNSGTTDNTVSIDPEYKSNQLAPNESTDIHLRHMIINFKSNTPVQENIYLNGSTSAITQVSTELSAHMVLKSKSKNLPLGTYGRHIQFKFDLDSTDLATNTSLEIDKLILPVTLSGGAI
ncbi:MAG: hypothetical protein KAS32_15160 [Candidatus Peribacteraceae bacterium]|nr:hypothetical protein [Candidatus Peribacteraceae bacterium]